KGLSALWPQRRRNRADEADQTGICSEGCDESGQDFRLAHVDGLPVWPRLISPQSINLLAEQRGRWFQQNKNIEPDRPVIDLADSDFATPLHFVERFGFAPAAAHLRETGNSRLDAVPQHVGGNLLRIKFVVLYRVRARADQ